MLEGGKKGVLKGQIMTKSSRSLENVKEDLQEQETLQG